MKVVTSGLITSLRGKLGSAVATRNSMSDFFRELVVPRNTYSDKRQTNKKRWLSCITAWRGATPTVKSLYATKSLTFNWVNFKGTTYHPSAYQLYQFLNMNIHPQSANFITSPPSYALLSDPDAAYSDYAYAGDWFLSDGWIQDNANEFLKIYISPYYYSSALKSNVPYMFLTSIPNNGSEIDLRPYAMAVWGSDCPAGRIFYVKTVKVNKVTGLLSSIQEETVTSV